MSTTQWTYKAITRAEFDKAYDAYPPNAFVKFAYKYFSKSTEKGDMKVSRIFSWVLLGCFLAGFVATVANLSWTMVAIPTFAFGVLLVAIAILIGGAALLNNRRLRKVMKKLNVTKLEYAQLVERFYPGS